MYPPTCTDSGFNSPEWKALPPQMPRTAATYSRLRAGCSWRIGTVGADMSDLDDFLGLVPAVDELLAGLQPTRLPWYISHQQIHPI
jgi:hypothetical protein